MSIKKNQEVIAKVFGNEFKARVIAPSEKKNPKFSTVYVHDEKWCFGDNNRYQSIRTDELKIVEVAAEKSVTGLVYDTNDNRYKLRMNPSEGQELLVILEYTKGEYKALIEMVKQCDGLGYQEAIEKFKGKIA